MEKGPGKTTDQVFIENWTRVADGWLYMIRDSEIPENIQSDLEAVIEEGFKKGYLSHIGRSDKDVLIFLEIIQDKFEEIPVYAQKIGSQIFNKIGLDIKSLLSENNN
jgi:hypothetical protein